MKLYGETTTFDEDKLSEDIETKRQVFTTQPDPPYSVGDLWVQGKSGEILVCNTQRSSGSYVSSDWSKASKYTDDSGLTDWIDGDYADAIEMIGEQIDAKAETYYQANDPSLVWSEEAKPIHEGDLWYRTTDNTTWYYTGSSWTQQNIPNAVFDEIDGKARIFTTQPTPPYFVGDLWFNSASSDILTCMTAKISGQSFSKSDWVKRNKYTDNSSLDTFRNGAYADFVTATQNGIASAQETADSRITTFYQATQPTANTEGDLWIDTDDSNKLYRWNGSSWVSIRDTGIQSALGAASNAQATADGKIVTFAQASQPTATDRGDLWIDTDDDNKLYRWDGTSWVSMRDGTIAAAATKATAYISEVTDDGIFVHEEDAAASPSTSTGVWITDAISIIRKGLSFLWAGVENNIVKIRLGLVTAGHVIMSSSGMEVYKDENTKVAEFGEDITLGSSGTHQVRISDQTIDFVEQGKTMAYMAEDKGYFTNQEIGDALYLGNYSLRQNSEGKLVIGRRR